MNNDTWTTIPSHKHPYNKGKNYSNYKTKNESSNDDVKYILSHPIAVKHFWNGFDVYSGIEQWFIEMDDGNIISSKNDRYHSLVKKFFPNDIF